MSLLINRLSRTGYSLVNVTSHSYSAAGNGCGRTAWAGLQQSTSIMTQSKHRAFTTTSYLLHDHKRNSSPGTKQKEGLNSKFRRFFQPLSYNDPSNDKLRETCDCGTSAVQRNKFDPADASLESLLENNRQWAAAVIEDDPEFFKTIALQQEPKILWIGCSDSRVPANQIVQLGPGEIFVHRNIANVVNHTDLNCLSVIQYAVEALKVEHIIVCGHYNCGGVSAALSNKSLGLIDNWLRSIKDVYRLHESEFDDLNDEGLRVRKLVELNAINSAKNVCHSVIVQNAWKNGQKLTVHAWAYDIEDGRAKKLDWVVDNNKQLHSIYKI